MPDTSVHVIILEDDEDISELFAQLLTSYGAIPILCRSGDEVTKAAANPNVALALLDIMLPETDGRDVAVELRKLRPDMPLYFMTGIRASSIGEQYRSMVTGVLHKPFSIKDLRVILDQNLKIEDSVDPKDSAARKVLELMTSVATERENIRRQQSHLLGLIGNVESKLGTESLTVKEEFREFTMGLEASLSRFSERLEQIQELLDKSN
ncbi:MAG: response regulator [Planctomycetes bacterium]|nr:response regulator [Planctomycetota bacterium]